MNITGKAAAMGGIFLSSLILAISCSPISAEPKADKPAASNRINNIKTYDLLNPRVLAAQQMDPKKPAYGSMPIKSESRFYTHEAIYGLAWRYTHDLTKELGYKDPWYRNPKLLKSAIAMGEYIISRQRQRGGWGWTRGYVENAFIGRTLAKAYVQLEPYLDDTVRDRKWPTRKSKFSGNVGDNDDFRGNLTGHIWLAPPRRWSAIAKDGKTDYRTPAAKSMSYFYYMNRGGNKYDKDSDGIIDAPFKLAIRYKDTGAKVQIKMLRGGKWQLLGTLEATGDNKWKTFTCDIPNVSVKMERFELVAHVRQDKSTPIDSITITLPIQPKQKTEPDRLLTQKEYWKKSLVTAAEAYWGMPLGQNWFVQNQFLVGKHFLLEVYHITGDKRYLDCVLAALNKYTFRYPYTQDGIQGEWNEAIRGATKRRVRTLGYDPNYTFTSESAIALIYNLLPEKLAAAERKKFREIMAKHFDTLQYLTMPRENNYYHQAGFGCRGNARKYNFWQVPLNNAGTNSDFLLAPFVFAECSPVAKKWAAIICEDFNTPSLPYGQAWGRSKDGGPAGYSLSWAPHEAHQFIDCYEFWKDYSSDYVLVNDRKEGYIKNLSETKIVAVKTGGYIVNLSYGSAVPSGGVIADVYSLAHKSHLFSGRAGQLYGLNCLIYEQDGKTASNNFDVKAKCKILSDKAPYKIQISGTLRHRNQKTVPINYTITYCFKDDAIEVTNKLKILKPLEGKLYVVCTPIQAAKPPVISDKKITYDRTVIQSHAAISAELQEKAKTGGWGTVDVIRMFEQSATDKTSLTQKYEVLLK